MTAKDAAIAVNRFGLGARPGELDAAAGDPKRWLLEQLEGPYEEPEELKGFATTAAHRADYFYRYMVVGYGLGAAQKEAKAKGDTAKVEKLAADIKRSLGGYVTWAAENFVIEYGARTNIALTTDRPFRERLVRFWSNHLVVPVIKQQTQVIAGAYEREAIRPRVTGKFADMLMASAKNPGMLVFLDNLESVGPSSAYGKASGKGLNENLAREILELHTMGVEGGYTQADVIELAKGITGWTTWPVFSSMDYQTQARRGDPPGGFVFYQDWHEPGDFTVVGKSYPAGGLAQGEAMLEDLARKPATARFLATKLARHFSADEPSADLVKRLADVYLAHDTDLSEMTRALVEADEVWTGAQSKLKQPEDYAISCYRALGLTVGGGAVPPMPLYDFDTYDRDAGNWAWLAGDPFGVLKSRSLDQFKGERAQMGANIANFYNDVKAMGQSPWNAPGPQGWYDRWSDWAGADSMLKRVEWSLALATTEGERAADPRAFLDTTLGALAPGDLKDAVARAATKPQGIGLVLASPDFQRR
ncbi:MAG: DUF1800 domain-containing protein [Alphaproteobacteria bacterium]|nr:DUF1800 domain-containing protein [Alphaproteobacteria bacterium]